MNHNMIVNHDKIANMRSEKEGMMWKGQEKRKTNEKYFFTNANISPEVRQAFQK